MEEEQEDKASFTRSNRTSTPPDRAQNSLLRSSRIGFGSLLLDFEPEALEMTLAEILQTRTRRAELAEAAGYLGAIWPATPVDPR